MYFKMTRAAVIVAGGAVALCLGSIPAALAAPAQDTTFVPCNPYALHEAIADASYGETLVLAPGCTYRLADALPDIMTKLTIVGHESTLTRTWDAGDFSLLTVGDCEAADVTVINVNFTDGGGDDTDYAGGIYNGKTLHVEGGTFSGNESDEYGGAIYNDGDMTVTGATFTDNLAPYGGAIYNNHDASIEGSSFTWNKAPTLSGDPDNSYGGAIDNEHDMYLTNSGFVANSTGGYGGAIYTELGDLHAGHITVTANAAGFDGGGIYNWEATATVSGSVVFGNHPDNCYEVSGC
jgi:predicted outer membrane repeat protein